MQNRKLLKLSITVNAALGIVFISYITFIFSEPDRESEKLENEAIQPAESAMGNVGDDSRVMTVINRLVASINSLDSRLKDLEGATIEQNKESEGDSNDPDNDEGKEFNNEVGMTKEERILARTTAVDRHFYDEERDDEWASEMESFLTTAFTSGDYGRTKLLSAECKMTFCRMEVSHEDRESSDSFELIKRSIPGSYYIQHMVPEDDNSSTSLAYFVREGYGNDHAIFRTD